MTISVGTRLGPYEILSPLGAGGMGEVYQARDTRLGREVALKVLPVEVSLDKDHLSRFEQEARSASALNHPNIITIYDIGQAEGVSYIAMELVGGKSLREFCAAEPLPVRRAIGIAVQIAEGLTRAHAAGIVHRDLKPENLMVSKDGYVKILDFGLAKLVEPESGELSALPTLARPETQPGTVLGTVGYMSPEQASGQPVDFRSDQFSLGSILYEMTSGRKAFARKTPVETMSAIIREEPEPLVKLRSDVPPPLRWIVERCLAKDPEERYASTRDLAQELKTVLDHLAEMPGMSRATLTPALPRRRNVALTGLAAVVLLALGWLAGHSRPTAAWENPLAGARYTRLTDFEGSQLDAAISADGKLVAFLADRDGPFDVWVGQVSGTGFVNVTHGRFPLLYNATVRNIGFTPDGTQVWVHVVNKDVTEHTIWLIPVLGGEPRPFLNNAVSVAWSPDGKRLVYHEPTNGDPVFVADATGAGVVKRFQGEPGFHWHDPAWGTDGRFLFFSHGLPREDMDVWRLPVATGPPERMTRLSARVRYPTPLDARTIVYCANGDEASSSALYALDLETRVTRRISSGLGEYLSIAATADGMHLVAAVANPDRNLWTVPVTERVVGETGATRVPLSALRVIRPRWDHDSLLFLSSKGGSDRLFRSRGRELSELWDPVGGTISGAPAVSPDGASICFPVRREGRNRLQAIAADGTNPRTLEASLDLHDSATWSADSKWIAVSARDETGFGLFKVPVDGGAPQRLVTGIVWNPVWSPDGRFIVYSESIPGPLRVLRAVTAAGAPHPLPEMYVSYEGDRYRFLGDSRHLVLLKGEFVNQDFWLVDLETGKERQLTNLKPGYNPNSFDVSPDERQIIFDRVWERSDVVLIDRAPRKGPASP
jgi:Tol biopolymer transport system component